MSGLVLRNGSVLVRRRPEDAMLGGLWELPGPQVREPTGGTGRLKQDLEDRLGTVVTIGDLLHRRDHTYSHLEETLHVYEIHPSAEVTLPGEGWRWVDRDDLDSLAMPTVYHQFRRELIASE
jgi:A/G-specific adenine glycosylase